MREYLVQFPIFLVILSFCVNLNTTVAFASLTQNDHASVNTTGLLKVNIVYYRDFPYKKNYANQQFKNCITLSKAGIIHCKEQVSLLRSAKIVKGWLHTRNKKGYLPFALKKYGITTVKAYITEVMPVGIRPAGITSVKPAHKNKNSNMLTSPYAPVTGIFIRHALDVSQYTFKNLKTKVVFFVTATPDHPVYAVNRRAFIGISQLSPEDTLLSAGGEKIELVCSGSVKGGCGTAFNRGKITSVYNIETSQRHTYFVQSENMLVHNCGSQDAEENKPDIDDLIAAEDNIPYKESVALIVKDEEGNPVVDREFRYQLQTIISLRNSKYNTRFSSPFTSRIILGVSDHKGYVADYYREASSLSLNEDGRLMVSRWFQKKKLVTDTAETVRYSDSISRMKLNRVLRGGFLVGAIYVTVAVIAALGIYGLTRRQKAEGRR